MPPTTPSPYRTTNHWNNHWNNQQEPTLYSSFTTTSLLAYSRCDYICQLTTSPQQKLDKENLYFRSDLENKKYSASDCSNVTCPLPVHQHCLYTNPGNCITNANVNNSIVLDNEFGYDFCTTIDERHDNIFDSSLI